MSQLRPWYAVATPHEDIREGRLSEDVFAANLWSVVQGIAPEVYLDVEAFFAKTYLTGGLTNVLRKAARGLAGGTGSSGDRIVSLQTAFGGGKTHSLVALWHLAQSSATIRKSAACAEVAKALGDSLPGKVKAVAVFTNRTCDATQGREIPNGPRTRTLWGEIAYQLGGIDLYKKIEANDKAGTVPQGLFKDILSKVSPCLILLDEIADYCVGASGVSVGAVTLADQTVSFVQELTDAVQAVKGAVVVATLPASHLEVAGSEKGQEILNALERRFGRMSADVKPVSDEEIYEVVRRRLFETVGNPKEHTTVADAYLRMYQQHPNEVPQEASKGTYKERILMSYPFHPTVIDALFLRWGSHGDFQRTRGVLRLLASVVGDLWQRRNTETQSQPLIQPCHVRWSLDALHAALTRLWGSEYESVVAADVIGDKSNAALLDDERGGDYRTERITQGLAAAILLGSFGGQGERAGYTTKDLKLCVGRPELNWNYTDGALMGLEERGFYLRAASAGNLGKRYWFGTKPTLTKLIVQYRGQLAALNFDDRILEVLGEQIRTLRAGQDIWDVVIDPQTDLPERRSLTLIIMPPDCAYADGEGLPLDVEQKVRTLSEKCGNKDRLYRNTLLFLFPSSRVLSRLRSAMRELEALENIKRDYGTQLDPEQKDDLDKRLKTAQEKALDVLASTYVHVGRMEASQVAVTTASSVKTRFVEHLEEVSKHVVETEEWVLKRVGTVTLQKTGLVPAEGGFRVKDAIDAFLRYTDKPMIVSCDAVLQGLRLACKERLIGVGVGVGLANLQRKWCGEDRPLDPNEEGVWIIPPFEKEQPATPTAPTGTVAKDDGSVKPPTQTVGVTPGATSPDAGTSGIPDTDADAAQAPTIKYVSIQGHVPLESWADVFRCFVSPSTRLNPKRMRLGIDFELEFQEGSGLDENSQVLKAMEEAARQLGIQIRKEKGT